LPSKKTSGEKKKNPGFMVMVRRPEKLKFFTLLRKAAEYMGPGSAAPAGKGGAAQGRIRVRLDS